MTIIRLAKPHYLALYCVLALLSGCASTSTANVPLLVIPEWVKEPPVDNAEYMYGIGEGYSVKNAQKNALKDIAGKIATSIKSESEDRTLLADDQLSSSFREKVNTRIDDIKLTNYKVLKTEQQQSQFYILVAMSRAVFIADKQNSLTGVNLKIAQQLKDVASKNAVEKLFAYNNALQLAKQGRRLITLLVTVKPDFDRDKHLAYYRQLETQEAKVAKTASFYIEPNSALTEVTLELKKALQSKGFDVSNSKSSAGKITLTGNIKEADLFGNKNAVVEFDVVLTTNKGKFLSRKHYRLMGSSTMDYAAAKQRALAALTNKLTTKSDIYELLGLQS